MKSVYITYTPYHILVSCGLASLYDDSDEKSLIIVSDFKDAEIFNRTILNWENNPFSEVKLLRGRFHVKKNDKINRIRISRSNLKSSKRFFKEKLNEASQTFIYHDGNPEGQIFAYLNSKKGGTNIYVEDGFAAYGDYIAPDMAFYEKLVAKMLWGRFYERVRVQGTYKYIGKVMVFYPEIVRPELRGKKVIKISKKVLTYLNDTKLISALLKSHNLYQEDLKANYIFIAPLSEDLIEYGLVKKYSNIFNYLIPDLSNVYVKYHPRETMGDFLGIQNFSNVAILPQSLPMEVVFLALLDKEPMIVIGDSSTSLLTAKYLLEKTNVISIIRLLGFKNMNLEDVFEKVGILMPTSIKELKDDLELAKNRNKYIKKVSL